MHQTQPAHGNAMDAWSNETGAGCGDPAPEKENLEDVIHTSYFDRPAETWLMMTGTWGLRMWGWPM